MTRAAFEAALDSGQLWTGVRSRDETRWYKCRRNGRTQVWKRDPSRFQIPVKFRFRDALRANEAHFNSGAIDKWFRISQEVPPNE